MIGYIYKTTCLITDLIYIGQHIADFFDSKYIGSGKKLVNEIKKYGKKNFICEKLCECESLAELNSMEKFFIELYQTQNPNIGYNISAGGQEGCFIGGHHSDEAKRKIGESSKNRIWIWNTETNEYKCICKDDLNNFDADVWVHRGLNTLRDKSDIELKAIGAKISEKKKGKYYFTNKETHICKMILKDEILEYINLGYWYGNRDFPKCGFVWLTDGINDYKVYNRDFVGILIYKYNLIPGRSTSGITWALSDTVFDFDNSIITKQVNKKPIEQRKTKEPKFHQGIKKDGKKYHSKETKQLISQKRKEQKNLNCYGAKGKLCYTNGIENKLFYENTQPDGWILGKIAKNSLSCYCIYQNNIYQFQSICSAAEWWNQIIYNCNKSIVTLRKKIKQSIQLGYYTISNKKYTDIVWFLGEN